MGLPRWVGTEVMERGPRCGAPAAGGGVDPDPPKPPDENVADSEEARRLAPKKLG